jgi:hypothetical protein
LNDEPLQELGVSKKRRPNLTRVDRWVISVAFLVLFLLLLPVYFAVLEQNFFQQCAMNLKDIGQALQLYIEDTGGLPTAYRIQTGDGSDNAPPAWVVALSSYKRTKASGKSIFTCPTAQKDANSNIDGLELSYGFYAGASGALETDIPNKDGMIVVAETVRGGLFGTNNPMPMDNNDGYLIAFDDSNGMPTKKSRYITRLAISRYNTKKGWDDPENLNPRHGFRGINVLFANGSVSPIMPSDMVIRRDMSGNIRRPWLLPSKK